MREPGGLYDVVIDADRVPLGLPLVAGLTGFADAGNAVSQLGSYLLDTLDTSIVVRFENDELLDYRARRPIVYFDQDHLGDFRPAQLALHLAHDDLGAPFLLLSGYEPDFQWDRFTAAMLELVDRFQISTATWLHSIPMPVPHTRPIGVTVSGNRPDLIKSLSAWRPRTEAPANALHLLEYRLQEMGVPTTGFILLVPHYLADTEYPSAAVAALDNIAAATGLVFPTERLREDGRDFLTKIEAQVQSNPELQRLVATLEERHDTYMLDNPLRSPLTDIDGELPTAESIAAELEDFLAQQRDGDS